MTVCNRPAGSRAVKCAVWRGRTAAEMPLRPITAPRPPVLVSCQKALAAVMAAVMTMAATATVAPLPTGELCGRMAGAARGMNRSTDPHAPYAEDIRAWGSWSAMAVLGSIEAAQAFPSLRPAVLPWAGELLDSFLVPGGAASEGIRGASWKYECDWNGVPPTLFVALGRGRPQDRAAIVAFANQTLTYAALGKMQNVGVLPDGALARSQSGHWSVPPLPKGNATQITWPDDTFMCTAMLTHAAHVLPVEMGRAMYGDFSCFALPRCGWLCD
jgi:hypothetical protein